jgi:hypothetical protein
MLFSQFETAEKLTDERVVVDKVVQLLSSNEETANDLALVDCLVVVGDAALGDEVDDAVGEHLRVDAQILVVVQLRQHRVRDAADAHLQGGAVLDQVLGNQLADLGLDVRGRLAGVVGQGHVHLDGGVKVRRVHRRVAKGAGHARVHLR